MDKPRKTFTKLNDEEGLDITIIEIKPEEDIINNFLTYDFDEILGIEYKRKSVYILHYPLDKNLVSYGLIKDIKDGKKISHYCNIEEGSSGGPILSLNNFKVIGIHYGGVDEINDRTKIKLNFGTVIKYAITLFNEENRNMKLENITNSDEKRQLENLFGKERTVVSLRLKKENEKILRDIQKYEDNIRLENQQNQNSSGSDENQGENQQDNSSQNSSGTQNKQNQDENQQTDASQPEKQNQNEQNSAAQNKQTESQNNESNGQNQDNQQSESTADKGETSKNEPQNQKNINRDEKGNPQDKLPENPMSATTPLQNEDKQTTSEEALAKAQQYRQIEQDPGGLLRAFIRAEYMKNRFKE